MRDLCGGNWVMPGLSEGRVTLAAYMRAKYVIDAEGRWRTLGCAKALTFRP